MKKSVRIFFPALMAAAFMCTPCVWSEQPAAEALAQRAFPSQGQWEFTFKPDRTFISYFLKGNVHDTLGYVKKMRGKASAAITPDGRLTAAAVQFSFAADTMDSNDKARDERMKKKFMDISIYPDVTYRSTSAGAGLDTAGPVAKATKERPLAFDLEGMLTIHGTTRAITIPVTVYPENNLLITEGTTILQLKDYNIKNPSFLIFRTDDHVKIDFHIELQPVNGIKP
jgi:polyisoprenoid-binding protein YceI